MIDDQMVKIEEFISTVSRFQLQRTRRILEMAGCWEENLYCGLVFQGPHRSAEDLTSHVLIVGMEMHCQIELCLFMASRLGEAKHVGLSSKEESSNDLILPVGPVCLTGTESIPFTGPLDRLLLVAKIWKTVDIFFWQWDGNSPNKKVRKLWNLP